jgi:site-specific recombinase XerD
MECVRLRVKDVDFEQNQVTVREGKGFKDRVTMLPGSLKGSLAEHLKRVKLLHEQWKHGARPCWVTKMFRPRKSTRM